MIICILSACDGKNADNYIVIDRFESDVLEFDKLTEAQKSSFVNKYSDILNILNLSVKAGTPEETSRLIPSTPIYTSFAADVKNKFGSLDTLRRELYSLKTEYQTFFPSTHFPQIKTFITPFNQSVVMTDTTLLIGLNHYMGSNHPLYGYFEEYQRVNKEPNRIIYDVTESLVRNEFNNDYLYNDNTLLSSMLYEGLIVYSVQKILGDKNEDHALGYSKDQLEWCMRNEGNIWNKIIGDDLLYSKSGLIQSKILMPAPFTSVLSVESPGRIGRWIGLRIIESYAENNKDKNMLSIFNDIKTKKSQTILMESRYDGR